MILHITTNINASIQYNLNPKYHQPTQVFWTLLNWILNDGGPLAISHDTGWDVANNCTSQKFSLTRVEHADHWCNLVPERALDPTFG